MLLKLFGIYWDVEPAVIFGLFMYYSLLCVGPAMFDHPNGWLFIPWLVLVFVTLATTNTLHARMDAWTESSKKLKKELNLN